MRNPAIELYRCLLMFGICLLHSISQGGHNTVWAANALMWCVPAFVFITGWFGIRFSFVKLLKLYGTSLYCAAIFVAVDSLLTGQWEIVACVERIWKIAIGQWFLNAYAVLMCFAPILNKAIDSSKGELKNVLLPILFVAFGWSFATTLPIIPKWIPTTPGLTAYSFLMMVGVYALARALRVSGVKILKLPRWGKICGLVFCLVAAAIGLGDYNSPFAIGVAVLTFYLVKELRCIESVGRVATALGPSMFSVYLIHSHGQAWGYLQSCENGLLSLSLPLAVVYVGTAIAVLGVCVIGDLPRRVVVKLMKSCGHSPFLCFPVFSRRGKR